MREYATNLELELAIMELTTKRNRQLEDLKQHWETTRNELTPGNLIKDGVKDVFSSNDFKSGIFKSVLSLGVGFLTRNLFMGASPGIVRKVVGTVAQTGATSLVYKSGDAIKKKGAPILSGFLKKLKID